MTFWVAGAVVGSSLINASSSRRAAGVQGEAARDATNAQLEMYDQNREDAQPWREAGVQALSQLTGGTAAGGDFNRDFTLSDFNADPGYQFRMDQGQRALERSAAARGGALGGGAAQALARYGQDYASGEFSNAYNRFNANRDRRFNRLASLANVGQTATRDVASMGTNVANTVGDLVLQGANARASGIVGQTNAITGGVNSLGNWWQQQNAMRGISGYDPRGFSGSNDRMVTGGGGGSSMDWFLRNGSGGD